MRRGGRMLGNSKLYGSSRPQQNEWRFRDSRMPESSRSFKDSQIQGNSRQHGDFRMEESRVFLESRMEPNYSPPRMSEVSEMAGNARLPARVRGGSQLQREVRAQPESRMHSGTRLQGNSRSYEDLPVHEQLRSRSNAVSYDYNHQRSDELSPLNEPGVQSNFMMNSNENMRSGRSVHNIQNDMRQGFYDNLPGPPNDSSVKKNLGPLPPKSYGPLSGIPPGSGHILTPSLTSSSGPQTIDGIRSTGNRGSYPKEKSSKAFDYLKTWRLKMNMPTDAFLLEKEGMIGNQQQGHDVISPRTHDDWYTQLPTAEPRVGRASIDSEWKSSGNSFAEKDAFGERPGNKYGEMRYGAYSELAAIDHRDQILESDRTGNPPWKWDEDAPNIQNQSAKRNYESVASGQSFNTAHRDSHYLQGEMVQSKRSRLSPSLVQNDREPVEQYASMISQQETLPQNNISYSDDAKFKIHGNDTFYESHDDWKSSSFHRRPPADSSKFTRSPHDTRGESVGSRHKLFPGEMKGMMAREGSQAYSQSRDMRNLSHDPAHTQMSPETLGRDRYAELHLQDRVPRLSGSGRSQELNQGSMNQGRPPPNEMFMASAPYAPDVSPRLYPRSRSHRSPVKIKSPGPGMRGKSPPSFSHRKSPSMASRARDRSSPWRKGKSPGLGRGRSFGPERERSPAPAERGSPRPTGKGRSPGRGGIGGLSGPSGKQRSPGAQRLSGPPRRERSLDVARRANSPGPLGRMRSPGPPRRGRLPGPQGRERSPGCMRRERSPGPPGRGSLDHRRWKSSLDHSGRGKSQELYEREIPLESLGRGKSPMLPGKGRSPVPSGGKSLGPPRRPPSLERGRSPGKSHSGRRGSQGSTERGKLMPESSGRVASPGLGRGRSSGTSGRARSPGTAGRDRSPAFQGRVKQTGASGRGRSPKSPVLGKPKTIKGRSSGLVPHRSAEYQEQPRSRSPATGLGAQRRSVRGQANSPDHPPRGRSPLKGTSLADTRKRSESFSQGKGRPVMKERSVRLSSRSVRSPVKRLAPEKNENLTGHEYREYRQKEKSPYLEEISLSPRTNRFWSPTRGAIVNMRPQHGRERSRSVDALPRGCSPVSPPEGRNVYPQEPLTSEREAIMQHDRPPHFYRDCSPLSVDGCAPVRKSSVEMETRSRGVNQRDKFYSPSREVSFGRGRHSLEKIHNTKGNWREHGNSRGGQHYHGKKDTVGKISDTKDVKKVGAGKFPEVPGGTLSEEEVDDEDLRIHLLRLREQKVEMKLMKLEEESKETELKLRELKNNRTAPREESPTEEERRYSEKETFPPHVQRQESYPWKHQRSPSEQERYHRQHKKY